MKVKKERKKILLALEIKLFSIATTDNLFTKQNLCLHAQRRSNTKYSVSENTVYSLCKHFSLTIMLLILTFFVNEGTPGNYGQVRSYFLAKLVQCCPWNLVNSPESCRKLSCNKQN